MPTSARTKALTQVHVGYLCMGLTAALVQASTWAPVPLVWMRMCIAAIAFIVYVSLKQQWQRLSQRDAIMIVVTGALYAFHWVTFFYAIKFAGVPTAVVVMSSIPMFSALIEPLTYKRTPDALDFLLALGVLGGVGILVEDFSWQSGVGLGVLLGLVSSIAKSMRDVGSHVLMQRHGSVTIMTYQMIAGVILLLPWFRPTELEWTTGNLINVTVIAIIGTCIAHTMVTGGYKRLKAVTVSLLGTLAPLHQILFGMIIVAEFPTLRVLFGGLIIIGIAMFETWQQSIKPNTIQST